MQPISIGATEDRAGQKQETHNTVSPSDLQKHGIHKRYWQISFDDIEQRGVPNTGDIPANYTAVKAYAAGIEDNVQQGLGLILSGNYGTMKTTMAVAILRAWLEAGHNGLLVPMCSLIDNLFTMRERNREEWARYENMLRSVPLLVIDDLGGENTDQKWVLGKVDSIITERYSRMLPVIITTNLSAQELMGTYGGRLLDRLKSTSKLLVFKSQSQRSYGT